MADSLTSVFAKILRTLSRHSGGGIQVGAESHLFAPSPHESTDTLASVFDPVAFVASETLASVEARLFVDEAVRDSAFTERPRKL